MSSTAPGCPFGSSLELRCIALPGPDTGLVGPFPSCALKSSLLSCPHLSAEGGQAWPTLCSCNRGIRGVPPSLLGLIGTEGQTLLPRQARWREEEAERGARSKAGLSGCEGGATHLCPRGPRTPLLCAAPTLEPRGVHFSCSPFKRPRTTPEACLCPSSAEPAHGRPAVPQMKCPPPSRFPRLQGCGLGSHRTGPAQAAHGLPPVSCLPFQSPTFYFVILQTCRRMERLTQ